MKLSLENKECLMAQGCTPERCMYWNTKTCLGCSKGVLWRELLKETEDIGVTNTENNIRKV